MDSHTHRVLTFVTMEMLACRDSSLPLLSRMREVAESSEALAREKDVEFVDTGGDLSTPRRQDPHEDEPGPASDKPHHEEEAVSLTAFNHFIDIKKGAGQLDDYDGYSYTRGSASSDQFEDAADAFGSPWRGLLAEAAGSKKVDEALASWFSDEYVHAPGQPWYRGCSPALERYSFFADTRSTLDDEMAARFPWKTASPGAGKGVPCSIFMPLDNLARYWYGRYCSTQDPAALGPVLHAIQDASVPHHAAACFGNWHGKYEKELDSHISSWLNDPSFWMEAQEMAGNWLSRKSGPVDKLLPADWRKTPSSSWPVDQLVTWMALNACRDHEEVYGAFRGGYSFQQESARNLTILALALGFVVLARAHGLSGSGKTRRMPPPRIVLNDCACDFGVAEPGEYRDFTFEIRNESDAPLTIHGIAGPRTRAFTLMRADPPAPLVLGPRQSQSLFVRFSRPPMLPAEAAPSRSRFPRPATEVDPRQAIMKDFIARLASFRPCDDEIIVRSNAANRPVLLLHLRAGGFPLPHVLKKEIKYLRETLTHLAVESDLKERIELQIGGLQKMIQTWR